MGEAASVQKANRSAEARFIGDVMGSFVFTDRRDDAGDTQAMPCRARSVSTTRAVVTADVPSVVGERVVLRFDMIGIRRGVVERSLKEGFIVALDREEGVEDVGARIDWLKQKSRGRAEDKRQHKRVLPRDARAKIILGAGETAECRIIDMSQSGTAVEATIQPPLGNLLAIGSVPGRVVRHFEGGFAVRFIELQDLVLLEGLMTLRTTLEKSLAASRLGMSD